MSIILKFETVKVAAFFHRASANQDQQQRIISDRQVILELRGKKTICLELRTAIKRSANDLVLTLQRYTLKLYEYRTVW